MNQIKIEKVNTKQQLRDFLSVPERIYTDYPQYVPDLKESTADMLKRKKNPGLSFCDIQAFVAYQGEVPVGRIAGIVNHKANQRWNTASMRFALLEFTDNREVVQALFQAAEAWGKEKGMTKVIGPMGITDFDKEGMLVEDFDLTSSVITIYNPPYYPKHLEELGYRKEVDWVQIRIQIPNGVPAKYARVAQYCRETIGLRVRKLTTREIVKGDFGKHIFRLLNEAYANLYGFSELSNSQIDQFVKDYLHWVDMDLIPVVFNDKDELVGCAITMPCLTEAMQKANGSLWPFGWYHLLKALKFSKTDHADLMLIAIRPDYQGLGVNAMFFDDLIPIYNKKGIKWAETGPQLETNIKELSQWKPLNPQFVKRRRCFTKELQ